MNLGSILPIVIGVVGIATGGLGLLAGGLLIAGGLASSGLIGGSVGSFMNSGWGKGLMAAATLGSAGVAMFGSSALTAAESTDAITQLDAANAATAGAAGQTAGAVGSSLGADVAAGGAAQAGLADDAAIQTAQTFSTETSTADMAAGQAVANGDLSATTGTTGLNTAYTGTAGSSESLGVNAAQADAQATQADTLAGQGGNAGGANAGPGLSGATRLQDAAGDAGATGASAPTADTAGAPQGAPTPDTATSATPAYDADQQINGSGATNSTNGGPGAGGNSGWMSNMLNTKGGAAAIQGGLSAIGGLGSGMMQQSAMQKQIAAQQWGNSQWQDPNQVASFEAQAAQPVTVPTGYLQRAQQIRSMMAGGVPTPSSGPVPMSSAMAPPGVGGPVPMSAMGAPGGAMAAPTAQNPRGGVI